MDEIIKNVYYNLDSPACFAGLNKVLAESKKYDKHIRLKDVKNYLSTQGVYTIYKPLRKKFPRLRTIASGLHTDWQCDLCIFDSIKKYNDGYPYLLVCVDLLSRMIYVAPAKSKASDDMIKAFEIIFSKSKYKPWKLMSDSGVEFKSKKMLEYFKDNEILKYFMYSFPAVHAGVVERANRTIKEKLYKWFEAKETERWIDKIDKIVDSLNNSISTATGVKPSSVTFKNAERLRRKLYKQQEHLQIPKFAIGDIVRTAVTRGIFDKSYLGNYSDELFTVYAINNTKPITYQLKDFDGLIVVGKYYPQELVKTIADTQHRIEKILGTRVNKKGQKEVLIKWRGYSSKHNTWQKENIFLKD